MKYKIGSLQDKMPFCVGEMALPIYSYTAYGLYDSIRSAFAGEPDLRNLGSSLILTAASLGFFSSNSYDYKMSVKAARLGKDFNPSKWYKRQARKSIDNDSLHDDISILTRELNEIYVGKKPSIDKISKDVLFELKDSIYLSTGKKIEMSSTIRKRPFGLYRASLINRSGDIMVYGKRTILDPYTICHEFCHKMGISDELAADSISYLVLVTSDNPVLKQAAYAERLMNTIYILAHDEKIFLDGLDLREEIKKDIWSSFETPLDTLIDGILFRNYEDTGMRESKELIGTIRMLEEKVRTRPEMSIKKT